MSTPTRQGAVRQLIQSLPIPPRPTLLAEIAAERQKEEPDVNLVAQLISSDVALSASVLQAANSPLFGLRQRITTPQHAVVMLGLAPVFRMVQCFLLKQSMSGQVPQLERFWDSAEKIAQIAGFIAHKTRAVPRDEAYTFGLFHDAGIPVLMAKFPNYKEVLREANAALDCSFTEVEAQHILSNHAVVGYFLAHRWQLSKVQQEAIRRHHELDVFDTNTSTEVLNLIAIQQLASHIQSRLQRLTEDREWLKIGSKVLAHFSLDDQDLEDLYAESEELLG